MFCAGMCVAEICVQKKFVYSTPCLLHKHKYSTAIACVREVGAEKEWERGR